MLENLVFWRLIPFYTYLLLLLQPSVLWLSVVSLIMMQSHRQSEFCANSDVSRIGPPLGGLPRPTMNIWPPLRGLPGLADRATRVGGSRYLSCKRDQIKMRDYTDRRVTPPKRVTSPTWGPPPPCKQALSSILYWSHCLVLLHIF